MKDNHILIEFNNGDDSSNIYELFVSDRKHNETIIKMIYSMKDDGWSDKVKGKQAASLKDNGNGVSIRMGKKTINLDYSEMVELLLLLVYYHSDSDIEPLTPKITKYKEL